MPITRRQVTQLGLLGLAGAGTLSIADQDKPNSVSGLNILVLGGTGFLGPHIVEQAIARGHTLTLFNRGQTGSNISPDIETIKGDRNKSLAKLKGRKWDVCIDGSAYSPRAVVRSSKVLKPNVGHMILVSSTSVYSDWSKPGITENGAVYDRTKMSELTVHQRYGAVKIACEQAAQAAFPDRTTIIRSDAIVGPGDHTHFRYPYWIRRAIQGGEILGPGNPEAYVQYIDVRDLAAFLVHCAESTTTGTYTATSASGTYSISDMIADCQTAAEKASPVTWVDTEFIHAQGAFDFPFWSPTQEPGWGQLDNTAAMKAGLRNRPKLETARDTHAFFQSLPAEAQNFEVGVPLAQEAEILAAWKTSQN